MSRQKWPIPEKFSFGLTRWQNNTVVTVEKKANKVVKIHELCWCLPFQESCMPMSWLWRDSKTPHGFYLIKLRKFQLKKRTVSFSRLQHFAIHSHQWRPQLQRHLLLPVRSFPHSFIQDLTLQYQQHNNLLKPDIQISQTFHRLATLHENCHSHFGNFPPLHWDVKRFLFSSLDTVISTNQTSRMDRSGPRAYS